MVELSIQEIQATPWRRLQLRISKWSRLAANPQQWPLGDLEWFGMAFHWLWPSASSRRFCPSPSSKWRRSRKVSREPNACWVKDRLAVSDHHMYLYIICIHMLISMPLRFHSFLPSTCLLQQLNQLRAPSTSASPTDLKLKHLPVNEKLHFLSHGFFRLGFFLLVNLCRLT